MDTVMQFTIYGDDALLKDAQDVITDIEDKKALPDSRWLLSCGKRVSHLPF